MYWLGGGALNDYLYPENIATNCYKKLPEKQK